MTTQPTATYQIFVRNQSNQLVGQLDGFDSLVYIKRFNQVGAFTLQLSATHPLAPLLSTPGYGIYVTRNGVVDFNGPVRLPTRDGIKENTLTVAGYDDLIWLQGRLAFPVTIYPYVTIDPTINAILREYTFGEPSGTTATDISGHAQNGTYTGTVTHTQIPLIDDIVPSTLFASGYVTVPTTGLPTGNAAFWMAAWFQINSNPGSTGIVGWLGTVSTVNAAYMGILSSGIPTMQVKGVNTNAVSAVALGVPHFMALTYDGTTATLYVDNVAVASATPGVCTIAYGGASFMAASNGTNPLTGYGNWGMMGSGALSLFHLAFIYSLGLSRFSQGTTDTISGPVETCIKHYANANGGPSATTDRQISNLTIQADAATGSTISYSARFESLIQDDGNGLLQMLSRMGTSELGFKVVQSGTSLIFQVYTPNDKTASAIFSAAMGNLGDYTYVNDFTNIINFVVAAGTGTGTSRAFDVGQDNTSIGLYGRFESFYAHGSATTLAQLQQDVTNILVQSKAMPTFNGALIDTAAIAYGTTYNLGDKVSIVVDNNVVLSDLIREVQVSLTPDGGEVVTPAIGTPNNGQIVSAIDQFMRPIQGLATRVGQLERSQ